MHNQIVTGTNAKGIFEFSCEDESLQSSVETEYFGKDSKCLKGNLSRPLCVKTTCDTDLQKVVIHFKSGDTFIPLVCENDGDSILIPGMSDGSIVECPNLSVACPE